MKKLISRKKIEAYENGLKYEKIAAKLMTKNGFIEIANRKKTKFGEIDLILENQERKLLLFCEIKYRKNLSDYINIITQKQLNRIYEAAEIFISENLQYQNYQIRFDVFIFTNKNKNPLHIENISF